MLHSLHFIHNLTFCPLQAAIMDIDLDFSCFTFDQSLPELGTCEELQDDAQNEILMGYPLYVTLLKNMKTMKKVLDDRT